MDITIPNVTSESSKPTELSEEVQIEELFLHNKNPELIFNEVSSTSNPRLRTYYTRARALEAVNIVKEMLMKDGPPPPPLTPVIPADDEDDDGWGGPYDGNNGGWGGPAGDNGPVDEDYSYDINDTNDTNAYATEEDYYEDHEGSEWSGYTSDDGNDQDHGIDERDDHDEVNPDFDSGNDNAGDDTATSAPSRCCRTRGTSMEREGLCS